MPVTLVSPPAPAGWRRAARIAAVGALALLAVGGLATLLKTLDTPTKAPARQVARIAVLPDTPPPPPPPKIERKEEPRPEQRPQPQQQPIPDAPPPPQAPIRLEGEAGDGPSAFAAGPVTQDYQGGAPVVGGGGASAPAVSDRAAERLYAGTVRQLLRDEIERHLKPEAGELTASFAVWVAADGRIARYELEPGAPAAQEAPMRDALDASTRSLRLPPPPPAAPPLRFRLTLRAAG